MSEVVPSPSDPQDPSRTEATQGSEMSSSRSASVAVPQDPELHTPKLNTSGSAPSPTNPPQPPAPKPAVFSLFLTPDQRKHKQEQEALAAAELAQQRAALAEAKGAKPRGRKPKNAKATTAPITSSTPAAPVVARHPAGSLADPNMSKTGETHPFFQEVKASSQGVAILSCGIGGVGSTEGQDGRIQRRYNSTPQESPFPQQHEQFHGEETLDAINGVVARLCGMHALDDHRMHSLATLATNRKSAHGHREFGWYSLQCSPDLGITPPQHRSKPRGKDSWEYWGKNRDQAWRAWSEKAYRLRKPSAKDKLQLSQHPKAEEYESCHRVAENQSLWHKTWATSLLTNSGISSPGTELNSELKMGELWTEKYRPLQGADVLGNRYNTEYLTQWLKALEVTGWTLNPEDSSQGGSQRRTLDLIGGSRKRRPTKKQRRKDIGDLNDFIVYDDDGEFEDPYGVEGEEDDGYFAATPARSLFSRLVHQDLPLDDGSKVVPKRFDIRSNTILLSGPTGSCKTAAVYACAEESGYEVFEVSPGMRRTGKEVLGLVGEMAENHHVHVVPGKNEVKDDLQNLLGECNNINNSSGVASNHNTEPPSAPSNGLHSFFKSTASAAAQPLQHSMDKDERMDEDGDVDIEGDYREPSSAGTRTPVTRSSSRVACSLSPQEPTRESEAGDESLANHEDTLSDLYSLLATTNPRQSLILLEEVDILFEDDKGFWASILTLLAKSKRPVVMTCNDTSKIPAGTLIFQEQLEFLRPSLSELHHYLTAICKIEGYICSSEYISGIIQQAQFDLRKCLMQLQYDSGLTRKPSMMPASESFPSTTTSTSPSSSTQSSRASSPVRSSFSAPATIASAVPTSMTASTSSSSMSSTMAGVVPESPTKRKPQRLLRISSKGIVPASAPTRSMMTTLERKTALPSPYQELELMETHVAYAETMSLMDSKLRMRNERIFQCFEADQFEASKDDVSGTYLPIYKEPSGTDHILMDQELAGLVQEGCQSLFLTLASQQGEAHPFVFEDVESVADDPPRLLERHFRPSNDLMSRNLQKMQPALEHLVGWQSQRFNLSATFTTFAPLIRSMVHAEAINTVVPPTGKRTMRSGGHLRRHLALGDQERSDMLETALGELQTVFVPKTTSTSLAAMLLLPGSRSSPKSPLPVGVVSQAADQQPAELRTILPKPASVLQPTVPFLTTTATLSRLQKQPGASCPVSASLLNTPPSSSPSPTDP